MTDPRKTLALALALALPAAPALAEPCPLFTRNISLCVDGTEWAMAGEDPAGQARYEYFGDGVTLYLDGFALTPTEHWAGRELLPEGTGPAEALADLQDWTEPDVVEDHGLDEWDEGPLQIARHVQTIILYGDDGPTLRASMIAASGAVQVLLTLDAPAETPLDEIDRITRRIVGLIEPRPEE